jgi:phage shock protein E
VRKQWRIKFQKVVTKPHVRVDEVLPGQVDALMAEGAVVVDLRAPDEYATGHIPGSINISRGNLVMNVEDEIQDLDTVVITYFRF